MYQLEFTDSAKASIAKFKKSNQQAFKKLSKLLEELIDHPQTGSGHPEPMQKGNDVTYSRQITKKDRLVYDIYDNIVTVLVLSAEGHCSDK